MKAGWEVRPIESFAKTGAGGTPAKSSKSYYEGGSIPWLLSGEVANPNITKAANFITEEGLKGSSAKLFPANSVLVAMYGATAGEVGILRFEAATNQAVCAVLPSKQHVPEYLYYYLLHAKPYLVAQAVGNAQPNISQAKVKSLPIPLPPLEEQQRIVAVLDEAFDGLSRARAHAEANLQNARELFDNFTTHIFMQVGDAHEETTLEKVCEFITDGTHQTPTYSETGYLFLSAKNVQGGRIDWNDIRYVDEAQHKAMQKRLAPRIGDLLIRKNGAGYGGAALVDRDEIFDVYVSLAVLRPHKWVLPEFLLQFANSSFAQSQFKDRIKGQGVPNLHLQEIRKVRLAVPKDIDVQSEIANKVQNALEAVRLIEVQYKRKLQSLVDLRQSLLQKAFAGELT